VKDARRDLCGGRGATRLPTATASLRLYPKQPLVGRWVIASVSAAVGDELRRANASVRPCLDGRRGRTGARLLLRHRSGEWTNRTGLAEEPIQGANVAGWHMASIAQPELFPQPGGSRTEPFLGIVELGNAEFRAV
jgi:hypothetical protein